MSATNKSNIYIMAVGHAMVDFLCAYTLMTNNSSVNTIIFYNFLAFVLQFPIGIWLDTKNQERQDRIYVSQMLMAIGLVLTAFSFANVLFLGIGNALYHVGGGVVTYHWDKKEKQNAKYLGIFVAPGALGLFLGLNQINLSMAVKIFSVLLAIYFYISAEPTKQETIEIRISSDMMFVAILCFLTVLLRSYCGLSVVFPWKSGFITGLIATLAIVAGKIAGGMLNSRWGMKLTLVGSLLIAALAFLLGKNMFFGVIALFCFNMTMPLTLYLLSEKMEGLPGTAFGLLTVALFVGYLLTFLVKTHSVFMGTICSMLSLGLLLLADAGRKI